MMTTVGQMREKAEREAAERAGAAERIRLAEETLAKVRSDVQAAGLYFARKRRRNSGFDQPRFVDPPAFESGHNPPVVGVPVTITTGLWEGDSSGPMTFEWWHVDGTEAIAGADQQTYVPVAGDVGRQLTCGVTVRNADSSKSATGWTDASDPVVNP